MCMSCHGLHTVGRWCTSITGFLKKWLSTLVMGVFAYKLSKQFYTPWNFTASLFSECMRVEALITGLDIIIQLQKLFMTTPNKGLIEKSHFPFEILQYPDRNDFSLSDFYILNDYFVTESYVKPWFVVLWLQCTQKGSNSPSISVKNTPKPLNVDKHRVSHDWPIRHPHIPIKSTIFFSINYFLQLVI